MNVEEHFYERLRRMSIVNVNHAPSVEAEAEALSRQVSASITDEARLDLFRYERERQLRAAQTDATQAAKKVPNRSFEHDPRFKGFEPLDFVSWSELVEAADEAASKPETEMQRLERLKKEHKQHLFDVEKRQDFIRRIDKGMQDTLSTLYSRYGSTLQADVEVVGYRILGVDFHTKASIGRVNEVRIIEPHLDVGVLKHRITRCFGDSLNADDTLVKLAVLIDGHYHAIDSTKELCTVLAILQHEHRTLGFIHAYFRTPHTQLRRNREDDEESHSGRRVRQRAGSVDE